MSQSYYYVIGPLISVAEEGGGRYWRAPDQAIGMIDLAKNSDFETDVASDRNIAFLWSLTPFGGAYTSLNGTPGDLREIQSTGAMRSAWQSATGFTPQGDTLNDLLADHLTRGADPLGDDACKPLTPTIRGELEIHLPGHSRVWIEKLNPNHRHWNKYVSQIQLELLDIRKQSQTGKLIDPTTRKVNGDYHRKVADALMEKCRRMGCDDFEMIRPRGWGKNEKPLKHATTLSDDFNRSDSTNLGANWDEVTRDFEIMSNAVACPLSPDILDAQIRHTSSLSSADHYAQVVHTLGTTNFRDVGAAVRFASGAQTFYAFIYYNGSKLLYKRIAGSNTQIGTGSGTTSLPDTYKTEASGSTIAGYFNDSSVVSVTDTSITANLQVGVAASDKSAGVTLGDTKFDDFEAGDLVSGGPWPHHMDNQSMSGMQAMGL
jgi:hypothetical protein